MLFLSTYVLVSLTPNCGAKAEADATNARINRTDFIMVENLKLNIICNVRYSMLLYWVGWVKKLDDDVCVSLLPALMALVEWTDRRRFSFFVFLTSHKTFKNNVLYDVLFTTAWPLLRVFQRVELAGPDITFLSDHSLNEHHMKRNKLANTNNICLSRRVLFLPIILFLRCYLYSIVQFFLNQQLHSTK